MDKVKRGWLLTSTTVLFGLLAISDFLKPMHMNGSAFVFLGERQTGTANVVLSLLFGLYLAVFASAIWRMRSYAVPMAWAFLSWVILNMVLFGIRNAPAEGGLIGALVPLVIGIGVPLVAAIVLTRRRVELA
ncbi:MAG TPA: hypothetical protein VEJ86_10850 [Candidatus Binataceae bacterium]|nr:hypothetical protein [Candidatus Binataceae bacterium]